MVEYDFWRHEESQSSDVGDVNYLLNLLTSHPQDINIAQLEEVSTNSRLLLARAEVGQIVGMATLAVITIPTGRFGRIEDVVVHDDFRGQGIGKSLMNGLIAEAKLLGLKRVDLTSRPSRVEANRMYQSLGFSQVETNLYRLNLED